LRYILVDRFLEIEAGRRARAVKCVTLGEPFLGDLGAFPPALVLEALLQVGGAVARSGDGYRRSSVLGKIDRAEFPGEAKPGDRIEIEVSAILSRSEGTMCEGVATVDGRTVGRARFLIILLPEHMTPPETPERKEQRLLRMRALNVPMPGGDA